VSEMNFLQIKISEVMSGCQLIDVLPDDVIHSLKVDSRKVYSGDWFICLKGELNDGHDFIDQALKAGAAGIIFENGKNKIHCKGIQVSNTLEFLSRLGAYWRDQVNPAVVAITGSNGKTSVKEIIAFLLEKGNAGSVCKSSGNYNNHFGVPYTLLSLKPENRFLVIEIGTNHPGEIKPLSLLASPDFAVITSVSPGHIGNFGNLENIFAEKSEIMAGLKQGGSLFVHRDIAENQIVQKKAAFYHMTIRRCDESLSLVSSDDSGIVFSFNGEEFRFSLCGKHQFYNLQLAFQVVLHMTQDEDRIKDACRQLIHFVSVKGRLQKKVFRRYNVWDDSYNANPASFAEAISFFSGISSGDVYGALGMMGELGDYSIFAHENLGHQAASVMKAVFFSCEDKKNRAAFLKGWRLVQPELPSFVSGNSDQDIENGYRFLTKYLQQGDHVLVKGSRSARMERIFKLFEEN